MSSNHPHAIVSVIRITFRKWDHAKCFWSFRKTLRHLISLIIPLFLAACASESVIHVPARYIADARLVPPDRTLILSDGARIPFRIWRATAPQHGIILALHGFNDSRDAWETTAPALAARGFTIWAPDQRGFGAAPDRGGWPGVARMVADTVEELTFIARQHPDTRLYLMGESMGGAIAMLTMSRSSELRSGLPKIAGTILLAPATWNLGAGADIPVRLLAAIAPNGRVTGRELPVHITASDNIAALRRLYFDPLTLHSTKLIALRGLVGLMSTAAHSAQNLHGPTLIIYGDRDQLVPADVMALTWRRFPKTVRRDVIPGGHHLLLRDKAHGRVVNDILSWFTDPDMLLPSGGDLSAATWASLHAANPATSGPTSAEPFFLLPSRMDALPAQ
ncbi:alpha/beta hydrolase [Acetobacter fallax]|uniref:alpha/beta hydrolase n=1 Tax=Acetobacter fallax TaxID=1737473 RepID=UPI0030D34329